MAIDLAKLIAFTAISVTDEWVVGILNGTLAKLGLLMGKIDPVGNLRWSMVTHVSRTHKSDRGTMMQTTGIGVIIIVAFSACLSCAAQSFPAGQVTYRAQNHIKGLTQPKAIKQDQTINLNVLNAEILNPQSQECTSDHSTINAQCLAGKNTGEAAQAAWGVILSMDPSSSIFSEQEINAAWAVAEAIDSIKDRDDLSSARSAAESAVRKIQKENPKAPIIQKAAEKVLRAVSRLRCGYKVSDDTAKDSYSYPTLFPTLGRGCLSPVILNYFAVEKSAVAANGVQYLYNAQESTSQVNADLITTTFPTGFQAVLAGTATAGSAQSSNSAGSGSGSSTQTDSVSTAVSKIENGGDFNVRFPFPVLAHFGEGYAFDGRIQPNLGFNINGFQGQSTITESSEYSANLPFEFYAQTTSIDPNSPAIGFIDLKPSGELISHALEQKLGLSSRAFFLAEAAVGIEFAQKIRVSLQYFVGPHQVYETNSSTGTSTTATHIGGFHLAVSFSPQKPSKSSN